MYIEDIVIEGFKSYASKVCVGPFDTQFNAITGLNGTGKSNVLDSICFVLGITNLAQVRVSRLEELVFKCGQAGISKASVTVRFNNMDKARSPKGYENHDKFTICRQVVIGGRNRYLFNGSNVQKQQIDNLFQSVMLNVNNPHFLIMQGRITKVINMKPPEVLAMIEEASGTRMYENKRVASLKTLEKKQLKMDEIDRILKEDIGPTLAKLKDEMAAYVRWSKSANEQDRTRRLVVAFEYQYFKSQQIKLRDTKAELLKATREYEVEKNSREKDVREVKKQIDDLAREKDANNLIAPLEKKYGDASRKLAALEADWQSKKDEVKEQNDKIADIKKQVDEATKGVEEKRKILDAEEEKFGKITEAHEELLVQKEKTQNAIGALEAGVVGNGDNNESLQQTLMNKQARLQEIAGLEKTNVMKLKEMEGGLAEQKKALKQCNADGIQLTKEREAAQKDLVKIQGQIANSGFSQAAWDQLAQQKKEAHLSLKNAMEQRGALGDKMGNLELQYEDPHPNFNRASVKGMVVKLFDIHPKDKNWALALEILAGSRLWNVVVDKAETAKKLLEKGRLRTKRTFIPLDKIASRTIDRKLIDRARQKTGGTIIHPLQLMTYDKNVEAAMEFAFGHSVLVDTPDTAKVVAFQIGLRCVTLQGDVYDPAGTMSGGSSGGSRILENMTQLKEFENACRAKKKMAAEIDHAIEKTFQQMNQHKLLMNCQREKEHALGLINDKVAKSAHAQLAARVTDAVTEIQNLKDSFKALPAEAKQIQKDIKSLETDIGQYDQVREKRAEKLTKELEQLREKVEASNKAFGEATDQVNQIRFELTALEEGAATIGATHEAAATEMKKSNESIDKFGQKVSEDQKTTNEAYEKLEDMKRKLAAKSEGLAELKEQYEILENEMQELQINMDKHSQDVKHREAEEKSIFDNVRSLETKHEWIHSDRKYFGEPGTEYDFTGTSYEEQQEKLAIIEKDIKTLSKSVNKKVMGQYEKAEEDFKNLEKKQSQLVKERQSINKTIADLDEKKKVALSATWVKVNRDLGAIFSMLLPHTDAKLDPPEGMTELDGLELKVAFNGVWKKSLTELSGGQRSLLSLSLVLALLMFKPAPVYILDEVDAALDVSHTQNIGQVIRTHFPMSQFIVVSLKDGMFNNANVLFRTSFVNGTSCVLRTACGPQGQAAPLADKTDRLANNVPKKKTPGKKRKSGVSVEEFDVENMPPAAAAA